MPEPRTMLKKLVGELCIYPVAFCTMKPRDQVELLFGLCPGLQDELQRIDQEIETARNRRAAINLELGRAIAFPEEDPSLPEDITDSETLLIRKQKAARALEKVQRAVNQTEQLRTIIQEQQQIIDTAKERLEDAQVQLAGMVNPDGLDVAAAKKAVKDADQEFMLAAAINERVRERNVIRLKKQNNQNLREEYNALLGTMKELEAEKTQVLADADMPIDGLSVDDNAVCFRGVPVAALSTSERVRVGAAIAVAQNPKAKLILADDASLLDTQSLAALREICEGFQLW